MTQMSCPRCGLVLPLRASFLKVNRCPRCLAGAHISVPMLVMEDGESEGVDDVALGELVIQRRQEAGTLILTLHGELDLASAPALQRQLDAAVRGDDERVLVDLRDLQFLDSTGLQLLLYAHRRLEESGRELVLHRGSAAVQRLFELTRVDAVFRFV